MNVYKLTIEQKDQLVGQKWDGETFFNPTQDADGNWFISIEEVEGYSGVEFEFVKELEYIAYNPVISEIPTSLD